MTPTHWLFTIMIYLSEVLYCVVFFFIYLLCTFIRQTKENEIKKKSTQETMEIYLRAHTRERNIPCLLTCGRYVCRDVFVVLLLPFSATDQDNRFRVVIFVLVAWTRAHTYYTRFGILYFIVLPLLHLDRFLFCAQDLLLIFDRFTSFFPHTNIRIFANSMGFFSLICFSWFSRISSFYSLLLNCILVSSWFFYCQFLFLIRIRIQAYREDAIQPSSFSYVVLTLGNKLFCNRFFSLSLFFSL